MQNLLANQYATYAAQSNGGLAQMSRNSSQAPPPLVRTNQNQSAAAHMYETLI